MTAHSLRSLRTGPDHIKPPYERGANTPTDATTNGVRTGYERLSPHTPHTPHTPLRVRRAPSSRFGGREGSLRTQKKGKRAPASMPAGGEL